MCLGKDFECDAQDAPLRRRFDETRPMLNRDRPTHFHHRAMARPTQVEVPRHFSSAGPSLDDLPDRHHGRELLHNVAITVKPIATQRSSLIATNRDMTTLGQRLSAARKRAGFVSARSAALEMDTPVSTYNSHERAGEPGAREFGSDDAKKYARRFGVSYLWLLTGEGDAKGGIPILTWVSAGEMMAEASDIDLAAVARVEAPDLPPGDWIALRVTGDSMDRISPPESIILVNRDDKRLVANACYVIADENGDATYKRFRPNPDRFEPVSVNPEHLPHFPDGTPTIIGRVRRTMLDM